MPPTNISTKSFWNSCLKRALITAMLLSSATFCAAQTATAPPNPFTQALSKYPGLLPEIGKLTERLKNGIQFPPDRNQSRLMPMLPDSTTCYVAFPNYGDAAHQALTIFQRELKESAVLRDWWRHGEMTADSSKIEDAIEKFYELSQYLGDEIVVSGDTGGSHKNFFMVAEVRKPGLKSFLQQQLQQLPANSKPMLRVLDPQELAKSDRMGSQDAVILVRPDFVVAAPNIEAARSLNSLLDQKSGAFTATEFGRRLAQSYQGGTGVLLAADLQPILNQIPAEPQKQDMLNRTGFDNVKFLVWNHNSVSGQSMSQMELSFNGPRHGTAAWLAAPTALGSLDFVSPKAVAVTTVNLKNLAQIFDQVRGLATLANPNAFASLDQMQQMMSVNLRNDLLSHLEGEITLEFDGLVEPQQPLWKAIFRVSDPDRLQLTLSKLLALTGQGQTPSTSEDGVKYYSVVVPSQQTPLQINYAFADGYLVIASSRELAAEGIRMHRSGTSFAKSPKLLASPPQARSDQASGLLYYDPASITAARMQTASPEMAQLFSQMQSTPVIARAYGDQDAIRLASNNGAADVGAILVVAAIAIPNLLRAKISANEASAVGTIRTVVTAQVTYSVTYPQKGFARELTALGVDPTGTAKTSPAHAGLIDWRQGDGSCSVDTGCTKSGYRFSMVSRCKLNKCDEFTALATPLSNNTGVRSFCATSDGVIRFNFATPSATPIGSTECRHWTPLQ